MNANLKWRRLFATSMSMLAMGVIFAVVLHPESAGATHSVHFMAGFMVGIGAVLGIFAFTQMRREH